MRCALLTVLLNRHCNRFQYMTSFENIDIRKNMMFQINATTRFFKALVFTVLTHFDGFMQDGGISNALVMAVLQSYIRPLIYQLNFGFLLLSYDNSASCLLSSIKHTHLYSNVRCFPLLLANNILIKSTSKGRLIRRLLLCVLWLIWYDVETSIH